MKLFLIILPCLIFGLVAKAQNIRKVTSDIIILDKNLYDNVKNYETKDLDELDLQLISIYNGEIKNALESHYDIHATEVLCQELSDGDMAYIVQYLIVYPTPDQGQPVTTKYALFIVNGKYKLPDLFYPLTYETSYVMAEYIKNKPKNDYSTAKLTRQMINGKWGYSIECKVPKTNDIGNCWTITHEVSVNNGKWVAKQTGKY